MLRRLLRLLRRIFEIKKNLYIFLDKKNKMAKSELTRYIFALIIINLVLIGIIIYLVVK